MGGEKGSRCLGVVGRRDEVGASQAVIRDFFNSHLNWTFLCACGVRVDGMDATGRSQYAIESVQTDALACPDGYLVFCESVREREMEDEKKRIDC